ncbi:LysR family transcriptional regulator [Streptomyces prunicolor]|uniref:LysR family transcriptional regulator n=1 Tax=Streptomyces prunicolor TaxID=67348 RepID=UPI0037201036
MNEHSALYSWGMDITLRQMELFLSVAEAGSFTKAAEEVLLSQPVLSRTVQQLEHAVGAKLFERTTRSLALTPEGTELLGVARDILRTYHRGMERFAAMRAGERGTVTVAALPSVAAGMLPGVFRAVLGEHPAMQLRILDGTTREVIEYVRSGAAELAIAEGGNADPQVRGQLLCEEPVLAVLPAHHPLTERASVTWHDLAKQPFVAFTPSSSVRRLADLSFEQAGVRPTNVIETREVGTAAGMISAGLGVSAVPRLVLPLMAFGRLVTRPLNGPGTVRKLAVYTPRTPVLPPASAYFLHRLLHTAAAEHDGSGSIRYPTGGQGEGERRD